MSRLSGPLAAPGPPSLGSFNSWLFGDATADLDEWLAAMERMPSEIDVYEEPA
ncbi:hypothetical protein ACF059_15035 [Streptomyces sp. NPDC016562]|uniref:hypothetical protein n=1 Tax=Streptomyces sp. NPDC016562 TaxID=3364966 RepID=UPI0036F7CA57